VDLQPQPGPLREVYVTWENMESVTARHLEEIAPYNRREVPFDLGSAALAVIDMQRFFLEPGYPLYTPNGAAILPSVRRLVEHFRSRSRPVIFAAQQNKGEFIDRGEALRFWWPTMPLEGSRETEVVDALRPLPEEKLIRKRRYSAFHATDLELTLRGMQVRQLVVAGLFTNVCVESTARDAFMRDFLVFIPADACASLNEELHIGALRTLAHWFAKVVPTASLLA
jgi:nicotinamidase-related amidase